MPEPLPSDDQIVADFQLAMEAADAEVMEKKIRLTIKSMLAKAGYPEAAHPRLVRAVEDFFLTAREAESALVVRTLLKFLRLNGWLT